ETRSALDLQPSSGLRVVGAGVQNAPRANERSLIAPGACVAIRATRAGATPVLRVAHIAARRTRMGGTRLRADRPSSRTNRPLACALRARPAARLPPRIGRRTGLRRSACRRITPVRADGARF